MITTNPSPVPGKLYVQTSPVPIVAGGENNKLSGGGPDFFYPTYIHPGDTIMLISWEVYTTPGLSGKNRAYINYKVLVGERTALVHFPTFDKQDDKSELHMFFGFNFTEEKTHNNTI